MTPTLSILIPSLTTRSHFLGRMLASIEAQRTPEVEVVTLVDDGDISIGEKRNRLLELATGLYTVNVDDDDEIAPDYCARILEAVEGRPDVVTFKVLKVIDGKEVCTQTLRLDPRYNVSHLCPVRAELAKQKRYPDLDQGEDNAWINDVRPLLKTERHVPEVLYTYLFRRERPGEVSHLMRKDFGLLPEVKQ